MSTQNIQDQIRKLEKELEVKRRQEKEINKYKKKQKQKKIIDDIIINLDKKIKKIKTTDNKFYTIYLEKSSIGSFYSSKQCDFSFCVKGEDVAFLICQSLNNRIDEILQKNKDKHEYYINNHYEVHAKTHEFVYEEIEIYDIDDIYKTIREIYKDTKLEFVTAWSEE